MQPYTEFASVYDIFMDNVPYDSWADYVEYLLKKHKIDKGLVLDLGCGTGSMTRLMSDKGYDMIGIDNSQEMLSIARQISADREDGILYLCQDMREFELYGTVAAVISVCDSMNYILQEEELLKVFTLVNNYLDENGLFIFDLDTRYEYEEILGDHTIAENREEGSFIWENTYYEDEMMNEVNLTLFLPQDEDAGIYKKYEETHYRRAYDLEVIKALIEKAGMEWVAAYDTLTEKKPKPDSERVYIIAREKRQKDKLYLPRE
ncbi:class I SAM-dependent methyltransferase [Mobilitalea sibirica]|uniref:Class I SAM-dependent methyltransferase n=1 Tax=Mobilitalea sibirica TaxID=1462919 RepID=A0A8J7H8N7_9FIRM|nr:class I SAM-dependent methyltransferase [Mobilitalea sibirica]MBH1941551.1 class I SAM-dependent methyltransferase [Mobilitalea sibirica]